MVVGLWPMSRVHQVAAPSTASSRGYIMLLKQLSFSHSISVVGHIVFVAWQRVTLIPLSFPTFWGGVFFSGFSSTEGHVSLWICGGCKPGDCNVETGHMYDEFTLHLVGRTFCCWVAISLGSHARFHSNPTSHLNQGMRIIPFWTMLLQILSMVLNPSLLTLYKHQNWMHYLMSWSCSFRIFAPLVPFLVILNYSILLASSLITYGVCIGCYFCLYFLGDKMSASKLICCFSRHLKVFGLQVSLPLGNITLDAAN